MATPVQQPPATRQPDARIGGRHVLVIAVAVLVAILVAAVGIVLIRTFADVADPGRTDGRGHRVTGTANGRGAATLDLVSGVSSVTGPEITATRPLQWPGDPQ